MKDESCLDSSFILHPSSFPMRRTNPMTTPTEREFAVEVVRRLREAGHEALWAGGCVRDELLGKTPKDYDVASSALPEDVQRLFRRTVGVGEAFLVVEVLGPRPLTPTPLPPG